MRVGQAGANKNRHAEEQGEEGETKIHGCVLNVVDGSKRLLAMNPPHGWTNWQFWQYSQAGSVLGIAGNVDMDYFNGSPAELAALFQSSGTQTENQPTTPDPVQTYTIQPGDTLGAIAARFGVTVNMLVS